MSEHFLPNLRLLGYGGQAIEIPENVQDFSIVEASDFVFEATTDKTGDKLQPTVTSIDQLPPPPWGVAFGFRLRHATFVTTP